MKTKNSTDKLALSEIKKGQKLTALNLQLETLSF